MPHHLHTPHSDGSSPPPTTYPLPPPPSLYRPTPSPTCAAFSPPAYKTHQALSGGTHHNTHLLPAATPTTLPPLTLCHGSAVWDKQLQLWEEQRLLPPSAPAPRPPTTPAASVFHRLPPRAHHNDACFPANCYLFPLAPLFTTVGRLSTCVARLVSPRHSWCAPTPSSSLACNMPAPPHLPV